MANNKNTCIYYLSYIICNSYKRENYKIQQKNKLSKNMKKFIEILEKYEKEQLNKPSDERNIYPTGTDAQLVVDCLKDLLLGDDWYVVDPLSSCQINTIILYEILYDHNKKFRKYFQTKRR